MPQPDNTDEAIPTKEPTQGQGAPAPAPGNPAERLAGVAKGLDSRILTAEQSSAGEIKNVAATDPCLRALCGRAPYEIGEQMSFMWLHIFRVLVDFAVGMLCV